MKIAIDLGDLGLCKRLVECGANLVSGFDECMGCTPLLYSLHKGQTAIATYLVSTAGSTCKARPTQGFTTLHYAAASNSVELLRLLLEKSPSEIYVDHDTIHHLHLAVLHGNAECVKSILDHVSQGTKLPLADIFSVVTRD